ncbi:ATP-binding protein [Allokutzneria albata]|uniref:AAA ATPase domain-containing protein n=1 Tax=Allokutzneria albata TaxID=211114 RepID=A0A1G9SFH4_ALLAB|nr:AAA family ATPase [Allokutzneria albata]SDM34234.1 AAA ATPase domain-containing protein [Allokutzneria albata]
MVGRDPELAVLRSTVDSLRAREGQRRARFLRLSGADGIGKTRLLAELATHARRQGVPVLLGRATEFEQTMPFGVLIEALDGHLGGLSAVRRQSLDRGVLSPAAGLFPALVGDAGSRAPLADRGSLHRALRFLLQTLTPCGGLVLILDDLHWADPATVEVLVHLVRHPPTAPILIASACREAQLPLSLADAVARADPTQHTYLPLRPLTRAAIAELTAVPAASARCARLYRLCQGNPFYLHLLERAAFPVVTADGAGSDQAPSPGVPAALLEELAALPEQARVLAHAAAVVGDPFDPDLAVEVAGDLGQSAAVLLDELVAADVVRSLTGDRRFAFRHPLVRHIAYTSAAPDWLEAAHARAAAALRRSCASDVAVAHHLARASRTGGQAVVEVFVRAAQDTLATAPASAAVWLEAAVRLLGGERAVAKCRQDLLVLRAQALMNSGRLAESLALLHRLLGQGDHITQETRSQVVVLCAAVERLLQRPEEAHALLLEELERLPSDAVSDSAELRLQLAVGALAESHLAEARNQLRGLSRQIITHDDRALRARVLACRAVALLGPESMQRAEAVAQEAAGIADRLSDPELGTRLEALLWLAAAELGLLRDRDASRHTERGILLARRTGQTHILPRLLIVRASALISAGPLDQALACAEEAVDAAMLTPSRKLRALALSTRTLAAVWAGDIGLADRTAREVLDTMGPRDSQWSNLTFAAAVTAHSVLGHPLSCVQEIYARLRPSLTRGPHHYYAVLLPSITRFHLLHDDLAQARAVVTDSTTRGGPAYRGTIDLIRAEVALAERNATEAHERARAAAATFTGHCRVQAALAHLTTGRALVLTGQRAAAVHALERAMKLAAATRAMLLHGQAARELRALGHHPAVPPRRDVRTEHVATDPGTDGPFVR